MSDLIRREDAFSKFEKACTCDSVDKNGMKRGEIKIALTWEGIRKILDSIPSAEPERKWIPVTEALPEDRQKVLCVNKHGEMMVGGYSTDYGMTFPCYFEKPIAWMSLPEPAKIGDEK